MLRLPGPADEPEEPSTPAARHGSAAEAVGEEILSAAIDLPWDHWLGEGAADMVRDGSLGLVRHAYPATAARDMRAASTGHGTLQGDAADHERLGAVALRIAATHHRPARMPHAPGSEPHAWWVAEERALVWMPWEDAGEPYGLDLLRSGQADAVVVTAPDACWTVYRTGLPSRGERGTVATLPARLREALVAQPGVDAQALDRSGRWQRRGDTVLVQWRQDDRVRSASVAVNRPAVGSGGDPLRRG